MYDTVYLERSLAVMMKTTQNANDRMSMFTNQTKEEWKLRVQKELKERPLSDIQLEVGADLALDPLYTADEIESYVPIRWGSGDWKIVESFTLDLNTALEEFNAIILKSLEGGCQVIQLDIRDGKNLNFEVLFKDVKFELIDTVISCSSAIKNDLESFFQNYFDKFSDHLLDQHVRFKSDLTSLVCGSQEDSMTELKNTLSQIVSWVNSEEQNDWGRLIIDCNIGNHVGLEIAKLRALKLLVYAVADKFNMPLDDFPTIHASIKKSVIEKDLEVMIELTTKTFTSVMAGCDTIEIDWEFNTEMELGEIGKRRLTRNIQWFLKLESGLHKQPDMTAGSYWIEKATQTLFEACWNN